MTLYLATLLAVSPTAIEAWLDVLAHAFLVSIAVLGALITTLGPLLLKALPVLLLKIKDEKARVAMETISRAGVMAATRFAEAQKAALDKAAGDGTTTDAERRAAAMSGVLAGVASIPKGDVLAALHTVLDRAVEDMRKDGTLKAAEAKFGDVGEIKSALTRIIEAKLAKNPVIPLIPPVAIPTPEALIAPGFPLVTVTDPPRSPPTGSTAGPG